MTFTDPAEHVRRGVARLRSSSFLVPDVAVHGFVIDLKSGTVDEVDPGRVSGPPGSARSSSADHHA